MPTLTGTDIRRLRTTLDLTAGNFAMVLGIAHGTLNRWEAAHLKPANVTGFPLSVLLALDERCARVTQAEAAAAGATITQDLALGGTLRGMLTLLHFVTGASLLKLRAV